MNHVLLLGAGFSRNWGGWLAAEALEYLLGCSQITPPLRQLLLKYRHSGGFEAALAELQKITASNSHDHASHGQLANLQEAVSSMFVDMDQAFSRLERFEPQQHMEYLVGAFLTRFDAIFTLNQDLLLERFYLNGNVALTSHGKWDGWNIPGITFIGNTRDFPYLHNPNADFLVPGDPSGFEIHERAQPYFKLHGSSNWYDSKAEGVMVLGGNKLSELNQHPILRWNYEQYWEHLHRPPTRVMIIGYGFGDDHINQALISAGRNDTLQFFIVDPHGIDTLNSSRGTAIKHRSELENILNDHVIGASRRPLTTTFGGDPVEHRKFIRFFE